MGPELGAENAIRGRVSQHRSNISYWTDGIMGDADDRFGQAVNNPEWNFRVAAVEALASRVLKRAIRNWRVAALRRQKRTGSLRRTV